jgi:hypothetical protein
VHCVFLETGNNDFFSRIVEAFCRQFVEAIIEIYQSGDITGQYGLVDIEKTKSVFKQKGFALNFSNCDRVPNVNCNNAGCKSGHITALALDQVQDIEEKMVKIKDTLISPAKGFKKMNRLYIQRVFQTYETANTQQIERLEFLHAEALNAQKPNDEYIRQYVDKSNKMARKAQEFVYIRAQNPSDYARFIAATALHSNLVPCDDLQHI